MPSTLRFAAILGLLSVPIVCADYAKYRLYHRLFHPTEAQAHFQERGTVIITQNNTASFVAASTFADDILSFAEDLSEVKNKELLLYQVALERDGDKKEEHWDVSSIKACHLARSTSEQIYLHTVDTHGLKPYAINYFVSPIPHDGTCPKSRSKKASIESFAKVNTTVFLKGSNFPPLPQLASPPPITPEGQPVAPVSEKTFLQKYWMYIAAFLVVTLLAGGGEEEKPARKE
ncbi:hypothetical protein E4T56_gene12444 [Termitomyces sp. T112]|nr:hypothetical protein C0989_000626 [Termitomyces sp. Mn162]KAG5724975.1 hypothetical protein E4T56_gene12444 [Termitomyces sp. T112]KAH0587720.1 hypothetical protein H2248_006482 [Termitomyces sp. 'cryptogamus']KNZ81560.1 hypothetical protein J132_00526 [Termitomyces sp. J132]